ncbi:unnamed protein product [Spirodela intermedia]|uniref:Uncharacterized protein n=1 Tax=Spirodela intermedia TaxID=51605 RepID=A0A7I8IVF4_SPIIN|nr:unnamed protein product [Spirodela intermedia]CAA6661848.1 unnamed protein product [Spirodela intermedia]
MPIRLGAVTLCGGVLLWLLCSSPLGSVAGVCELSVVQGSTLYNYSLPLLRPKTPTAPKRRWVFLISPLSYPSDLLNFLCVFYKIVVNDTSLWFQLCNQMIFNHDPPRCLDCEDCGGPSHCGMKCSALVENNIGGYAVCTTIGQTSSLDVELIDGASGPKRNCSLSVSIFCDMKGVEEPELLEVRGSCDYGLVLRHPSGCPTIISIDGKGLGWFGTLLVICLSAFQNTLLNGTYFSAGIIYRFFFLKVRGADVIPNLEFWSSAPQRLRRMRAQRRGSQSSYAPMNF